MLASGVGQSYQADGTPAESHPMFRPHPMQGWSPDFIPRLTGDAIEGGLIDAIQPVSGAEALRLARELARQEGIFCGISGGATLAAALEVAEDRAEGQPDPVHGSRYRRALSVDAAVRGDRAGDGCRGTGDLELDAARPVRRAGAASRRPRRAAPVEPAPARARDFVAQAIGDPEQPVVMFALEWCEFCWAVRRFLTDMGVPFRSVDLDAVAMQASGLGGEIRKDAARSHRRSQRSRRSSSAASMSAARSTSSHDTTAANWSRCWSGPASRRLAQRSWSVAAICPSGWRLARLLELLGRQARLSQRLKPVSCVVSVGTQRPDVRRR